MKYLSLIILFLFVVSYGAELDSRQHDLYKDITFLKESRSPESIELALTLFDQGEFGIPMGNQIFWYLKGKGKRWCHFKLNQIDQTKTFTIWNNFLDYSRVYLRRPNGDIISKSEFSLLTKGGFKGQTRKPIWTFNNEDSYSDVFVVIEDYNLKTNLNMYLLSTGEHNELLQQENAIILLQSFFLMILLIFVFLIFIAKKEFSLLWYAFYIFFFLVEYLFHMGVHNQYGVLNYPVLQSASQVFIPNMGMLFACLFFIGFYKYNKATLWVKQAFKFIVGYFALVALIFFVFFIANAILFSKEIIIYSARFVIICILLLHIYLALKKTIPYYLAIAFILPIVSFFVFINDEPNFTTSFSEMLLFDNLVYIATSLEICIVLFFIVRNLITSELMATKLKNENLILRDSFNNSLIEAQEKERTYLLENVHDTLGGYIEALKLRMSNGQEQTKGLLDAFYKDYRYILNNLYSPKINSSNLTEHIIHFIQQQNQISGLELIQYQFDVENLKMSSGKCMKIYRMIAELITNALKHSKASLIQVHLSQGDDGVINLRVEDNGVGFQDEVLDLNSYGLKNLSNSVKALNGHLELNSSKNIGAVAIITIPEND